MSTAYYAMFHCLAGCAANLIIGCTRKPAWRQTYRALEHGKARNACEDRGALTAFPPEVRSFADMFVALQKARQQADYALDGRYDKLRVLAAIDMAEDTIVQFDQAGVQHRRAFVAHVLFKRPPPPANSRRAPNPNDPQGVGTCSPRLPMLRALGRGCCARNRFQQFPVTYLPGIRIRKRRDSMSADGTWNTTMQTPMGPQQGKLLLKTDGNVLTGKLSGSQGEIEIKDGTVDGNSLAWKADITTPMAMTLEFSATVNGDEISGNVKLGAFGNASLTGTRA